MVLDYGTQLLPRRLSAACGVSIILVDEVDGGERKRAPVGLSAEIAQGVAESMQAHQRECDVRAGTSAAD